MKEVVDFLIQFARAISDMTLYKRDHPSRQRSLDAALERLARLQEERPTPRFTFLGNEIVVDDRPVSELKNWGWGFRMAEVGIERLEFVGPVDRDDLEAFLEYVFLRLTGKEVDTADARPSRPTNIRYGMVRVQGDQVGPTDDMEVTGLDFTLREEADAVRWMHQELKNKASLPLLEAEAVVRALSVAMRGDQAFLMPLLKLKRFDQYTTTHALNVSVLAIALAEFIGLGPREVRTLGIAGLLHDLGKTTIPEDILNKPGLLTDQEREVMNQHPTEGARLILETEQQLDLAAVVAYEHHIKLNGKGYPSLAYARPSHPASDMVHLCDVYDALRTARPYRDAWEHDRVMSYLAEGVGTEFNPELAHAFGTMMETWATGITILTDEDQAIPTGHEEEGEEGRVTFIPLDQEHPDGPTPTPDSAQPESDA